MRQLARVKIVGRPYRGHEVGAVVEMRRQDAVYLAALRRVEIIPPADDVEFTPAPALEETVASATAKRRGRGKLQTPEAPLENVAHTEPPGKRAKKTRRGRGNSAR